MKKKLLLAVCGVGVMLMAASMLRPNLMRMKLAPEHVSRMQGYTGVSQDSASTSLHESELLGAIGSPAAGPVPPKKASFALGPGVVFAQDQMVVRSARLDLLTRDVRSSVDQVRTATQRLGGFIEKASLSDTGTGVTSAELIVRVPKDHLDDALAAFKGAAVRVENEAVEAQDVTREWVDSQARLRNLKAEEDQYLSIMKRAAKVQDTMDVAEKLSGVRGEIERLQADLNYLSHQVAMSAVKLNVKQQSAVVVAGWHPGENAREAWQGMVSGLTAFADFVVTVVITLPLLLVWIVTLGALGWALWKAFVLIRKRFPATTQAAS